MHVTAAHIRLAGVLGRFSRCECYRWKRKVIAVPFWALVSAAVAGVAGGELAITLGFLSDETHCRVVIRTKILFIYC